MKLFKNLSGFTLVELLKKFSLILLISFFFDSSSASAQTLKNPALNNCVSAPAFVPTANNKRPINDYDCVPTPVDSKGNLSIAADRDYTLWKDTLLTGADKKQVTGFYTKRGARCETATQATTDCPIAVKAKYVFDCGDDRDTVNFYNGKCAQAKTIKVYHATYQAITIPGEAPIRPTIVGDLSVHERAIAATPIATATISTSIGKGKYECKDLQVAGGPPLFQKGEDAYGNPICLPDTTVEIMRETICKQMMQLLWNNGRNTSSSSDPCEIITISKVFRLSNTGKTNYNTNDCTANYGRVFDGNTDVTDSLKSYPGGTISGAINSEAAYFAKYGQQSPSPTFRCKMKKNESKSITFSDTSKQHKFKLSSKPGNMYRPGSLYVALIGGGAGGAAGGVSNGGTRGNGGGTWYQSSIEGYNLTSDSECNVTIGGGGTGKNDEGAGNNCDPGTPGGTTTFSCGTYTASGAAGQPSVNQDNNSCRGNNNSGEDGGNVAFHAFNGYQVFGTGGKGYSDGNGGAGSGYGGGGAGGGSEDKSGDGSTEAVWSGGNGASGYFEARWTEEYWADW